MFAKMALIGLFMATSASAMADVKLTESDILGKWTVDSEALSLDGKARKELSAVWSFRNDGTMEGVSTDSNKHARLSELRAVVTYSIEDGKIKKQVSPGRSKTHLCTAVEFSGSKMVLECNQIYFFLTKQ